MEKEKIKEIELLSLVSDQKENALCEARINGVQAAETDRVEYSYAYIYNSVIEGIKAYEIEYDISIINISQLQFNHVLLYLNRNIVKNILTDIKDITLLINLFYILRDISYLYNKTISLYSYSLFTGIQYNTLRQWNHNSNRHNIYIDKTLNRVIENKDISFYKYHNPNSEVITLPNDYYNLLCKTIRAEREQNLTAKAESGSVMSLALGKIEYGWIEGKDKQLQADILQNTYSLPDDVLDKYK